MRVTPKFIPGSDTKLLFILGSPRVGSTLLYQVVINHFDVFYPANSLNNLFESDNFHFSEFPIYSECTEFVDYKSVYGKTLGEDQPSEASGLFRYFFGGEHPSESKSKEPLPGLEKNFVRFMDQLFIANNKPLVFKNAWNCFRIEFLSKIFPKACFLWIRRNLADSAYSDLQSRRQRGSTEVWNSATTSNYKEIQELPYWEQVVEQQYSYAQCISKGLSQLSCSRYFEVWYEDLCGKTIETMDALKIFLEPHGFITKNRKESLKLNSNVNYIHDSPDNAINKDKRVSKNKKSSNKSKNSKRRNKKSKRKRRK